jgi:hypothetical protein
MILMPTEGKSLVSISQTLKDGSQVNMDIWAFGTEVSDKIATEMLEAHGFLVMKQPDAEPSVEKKGKKVLKETVEE